MASTNNGPTGPTSFEWKEYAPGKYQRPLSASEDRWDSFHRGPPTAWVDFCSIAFFDASKGQFAAGKHAQHDAIEAWAQNAIAHVLLRAPLLMGRIDQDTDEAKQKYYRYDALSSLDDLKARAKSLVHVDYADDVQAHATQLSSQYYSDKKRVSVELGPALIRFVVIASSKDDGKYALFLQTTHCLIDYWALMSLFEVALDAFARNAPLPSTLTPNEEVKRLTPSYLEVMKDPKTIDYYNPNEEEKQHAAGIMGQLLQNPLGLRIDRTSEEEKAKQTASVETMTIKHVFSPETTKAIAASAKKHGQSVNEVIQAAQIAALQAVCPVPADNKVRTHAPSGILNILPRTTMLDGAAKETSIAPSHQPFMGSLMVPYVCDIGPLLDVPQDILSNANAAGEQKKQRSDAFWYVAKVIGLEYKKSQAATAPLKAFWDKGPALWGGFVDMMPAVFAGHIPSPPAVYPPLSNAGILDQGRHLRASHTYTGGDDATSDEQTTLTMTDFAFYPRVLPLFGTMNWAWTIFGRLHTQAALPDPRETTTPDAPAWFAKANELLEQVAVGAI